jgi:uncharacterized cupin superfamily protein
MEPKPGFFVMSANTTEWEDDPEVPGTEQYELVHADGLNAGFSRSMEPSGPLTWTPESREVAFVVEGTVRIEFGDGTSVELGPGDLFSIPPGLETTWHASPGFKEVWVLGR